MFIPVWRGGNPVSPGQSRPAGASGNRSLMMPRSKFSCTKIEMALFSRFCPRNGSHRSPALIVTRFDARHESCAYAPMYVLLTITRLISPCSTVAIRPASMSASPSPVFDPVMRHVPLARDEDW